MPDTSWMATIITRVIPSRITFLVAYEAVILVYVASAFNWG